MAVSKERKEQPAGDPPDPAPFDRIIREGLADIDDVLDAYQLVLGEWGAAGGHFVAVEITQERPVIDPNEPPSVQSLLIRRNRERMFQSFEGR